MPNFIVVSSRSNAAVSAHLATNTTQEELERKVQDPSSWVTLYALAGEGDPKSPFGGIALTKLSQYEPTQFAGALTWALRAHWMGKTNYQIEADYTDVMDQVRRIKDSFTGKLERDQWKE
jgi:hypothetical protein